MAKKILIFLFGLTYDLVAIPAILIAFVLYPFIPKLKIYIRDRLLFNGNELKNCDLLFFCSSIGEFDQVIPLLEKMKTFGYKPGILFHSKNGYEYARQLHYKHIALSPFDSFIFYLYILNKIRPKKTILNRNEAWPGFLTASAILNRVYVTNFIERKYNPLHYGLMLLLFFPVEKVYTSNHGKWFRYKKFVYTGDTKTDRVQQRLKDELTEINQLLKIYRASPEKLLVIGNAYVNDCMILQRTLEEYPETSHTWKVIIIPGRPGQANELELIFRQQPDSRRPKIIPAFGNLLHYYAIADYAWIGGGFNSGIHNVIEALCAGKQMICGPNLNQQPLALDAARDGNLETFSTPGELYSLLNVFETGRNKSFVSDLNPSNKIYTNIEAHESDYSS